MATKVWVIKPTPKTDATGSASDIDCSAIHARLARSQPDETKCSQARRAAEADREDATGSPPLTVLAYALGPFAVAATRSGRRSAFWISVAIVSSAVLGFVLFGGSALLSPGPQPGLGFIIPLLVACMAIAAGFAAWTRGVLLLGRHRSGHIGRLPAWIRHPGAAGILGLVVPGYGLFIAKHARRAACALMVVCAAVVSLFILRHSSALWHWNQAAGPLASPPDDLERLFLALGALVLLGALAWVVQWLDGMRLAGYRTGRDEGAPGSWAGALLLAAVVTFSALFHPSNLAETVDRFAVSMRLDGLRIIPLYASEAAMRLDPSEPKYVVRAIEINESLGRDEAARRLRRQLDERWKPYQRLLQRSASPANSRSIQSPPSDAPVRSATTARGRS